MNSTAHSLTSGSRADRNHYEDNTNADGELENFHRNIFLLYHIPVI
jgi:hypothetical protein